MAQEVERVILEIPEGYEPQPYEPAQVRRLSDIRNDFDTEPEQWMDDLIDTLTEINKPAEEIYLQDENLRIMQYRIDHAKDEAERQSLIRGQEELLDRYTEYRLDADEEIEAAIIEETKRHYLASLNILNDHYQPIEDEDEADAALSEERLLEGYQPAPFEKGKDLPSIEEQRELYEVEDEESGEKMPVDEEDWALGMQGIIMEEEMPAGMLYDQEEMLRKLQYQIDRLNENPHVKEMVVPYEIIEPDEDMLSEEDYQRAVRDQLYKEDLNRRFEKRRALEIERDNLVEMISEERQAWMDEVDRRMDEELALRQDNLEKHQEWLQEQEELAAEEAKREREEAQRQAEQAERARIIAKEERKRQLEENERRFEEEKRRIAEEEAERQRRIEVYKEKLRAQEEAEVNRIFAERVRLREEQLKREEEEKQYRAEQLERQRKFILSDALGGEQTDENGFFKASERTEGEAGGTGLDELLQEGSEGRFAENGEIDLSGAQNGQADDFFEKAPGAEFTGNDEIDLSGAQSGQADDFFEKEPGHEENPEEDVDEVPALEEPALDDLVVPVVENHRPILTTAYRLPESEYKARFLEKVQGQTNLREGDRELLSAVFDARLMKNHAMNKDLNAVLEDIGNRKSKLNSTENRKQTFGRIKECLDRVPQEQRNDAHKKASDNIQKEIERISTIEAEADLFAEDMSHRGWPDNKENFRNLYLAGKTLPTDHPYCKLLEDMRAGKSQSHPEFPLREAGFNENRKYYDKAGSVISHLQLFDDLGKAKELLEKEGNDSPDRQKAIESIDASRSKNQKEAKEEQNRLPSYQKLLALGKEGRERLGRFLDAMGKYGGMAQIRNFYTVRNKLSELVKDPLELGHPGLVNSAVREMKLLRNQIPTFICDMKADHPLYQEALKAFAVVAPDVVETAKAEAERELRERRTKEFNEDLKDLKTIEENFGAVGKSYIGHTNSEEYNKMMEALKTATASKSWEELKKNKEILAERTKEYLDHTGLGKASIFHKNAETRRKLAFYTLHKSNSPERPFFDSYLASANQVRSRSHRISIAALKNLPGIGKPLGGVREINAGDLMNKMGVHEGGKETHQRKVQTVVQPGPVKETEKEGLILNSKK